VIRSRPAGVRGTAALLRQAGVTDPAE